jgi:AcrR family transcriptional regulator
MSSAGSGGPGNVWCVAPLSTNRPPSPRGGKAARGGPRRATHSLEQIVSTAIAMLDRDGTKGLTLRGLAGELGGGLGSVYWYVDGKDELLTLACESLVGEALVRAEAAHPADSAAPSGGWASGLEVAASDPLIVAAVSALRGSAIALFEQTQLHPWLAPQLQVQAPGSPNVLRFWERIGRSLAAMGLSRRQQLHASMAVTGYVIGVAAEMAAQDQHADPDRPRDVQLDEIVTGWVASLPAEFTWIQSIAVEFRDHDDDEQFAAGLDLLLGGLFRQAVESAGGATD